MGEVKNVVVGDEPTIKIGAANSYPSITTVGFTVEGAVVTVNTERKDIKPSGVMVPLKRPIKSQTVTLTLGFFEATLENLGYALPGADSSVPQQVTIGDGTEDAVSVLVEGNAPGDNSGKRVVLLPCVNPTGQVATKFEQGEEEIIPVEYSALTPSLGKPLVWYDCWDVTIATGEFAHTAAKSSYRMGGEGAAADDLDDITGATDGDTIRVCIASPDQAITVKHLVGTIELTDTQDLTLANMRDYLVLQYSTDHWVEVSRFVVN